ncbi:hypothetical protein VaNZ11_015007 [Volvox africanus]|uniref:Uncharacterized protein n=1 Tax=Volvox africanus TaxID=51714 RepID=A0ABQ5SJN0_9CHLO|nr:hypothetical protein VaNZ11_015007 [Volvox africanus]
MASGVPTANWGCSHSARHDGTRKSPMAPAITVPSAAVSLVPPPMVSYLSQPSRPINPSVLLTLAVQSSLTPMALPRRPISGPRDAPRSDLRMFEGAKTPRAVMLRWKERSSSTSDMLINVEALRALERCLSTPGTDGRVRSDDLLDLQAFVWDLLRDLDRRTSPSFQLIAGALSSLQVVLPALDWPVRDPRVISNIAARLAPAASAANKLAPVPLEKLCGAFRSLALLAEAASSRGRGFIPDVMREAGRYLQTEVLSGNGLPTLLEQADMAVLAMAVELIVKYDLAASEVFVTLYTRRVDGLVAAAQQSKAGEIADGGDRGNTDVEARTSAGGRGRGSRDTTICKRHRTGIGGEAAWTGRGKPVAGAAIAATGAAAAATEQAPAAASVQFPDSELDLESLARVLVGWCYVKPGRPGPTQAWLRCHAELVLRTQDATNASCLAETQKQLAELSSELMIQNKRLRALPNTQQAENRDMERGELSGNSAAGSGRGGGRGLQHGDRGSGRGQGRRSAADRPRRSSTPSAEDIRRTIYVLQARQTTMQKDLAAFGALMRQIKPLQDTSLVILLEALASKLGADEGRELGGLAEAVVAARVGVLGPCLLVQAIAALANLGHIPSRKVLVSALSELQPHLHKLDHRDTLRILDAWYRFDFVPDGRSQGAGMSSIMQAVDRHGGLSEASTALVCQLCRISSRWEVPFQEKHLRALQEVVESRVLESLPVATIKELGRRAQVLVSVKAVASSTTSPSFPMSLEQLLQDVLLPLAQLGQGFQDPEMFTLAIGHWSGRGFEGLDERKAALLLNTYAHSLAWPAVPALRERVHELLQKALTLRFESSTDLSVLLLAASRALRLLADKMQRQTGTPVLDVTESGVAVLVLPAVERLMQLNPKAQHLADAAQGLFVELLWRGGQPHTPREPVMSASGTKVAADEEKFKQAAKPSPLIIGGGSPDVSNGHEADLWAREQLHTHLQTEVPALPPQQLQGQLLEQAPQRAQEPQDWQPFKTQKREESWMEAQDETPAVAQAQELCKVLAKAQELIHALGVEEELVQALANARELTQALAIVQELTKQRQGRLHGRLEELTQILAKAQELMQLLTDAQVLTQELGQNQGQAQIIAKAQGLTRALSKAQELKQELAATQWLTQALEMVQELKQVEESRRMQAQVKPPAVPQPQEMQPESQPSGEQLLMQAPLQVDPTRQLALQQARPHTMTPSAQAPALKLLVRILTSARPSLRSCSLQGHGYLLAACNEMQYRPPMDWLVCLYKAMAVALDRGHITVDLLVDLLNAVSGVDSRMKVRSANDALDADAGAGAGATTEYADECNTVTKAKGPFLTAMAAALLKDPVLTALSQKPNTLAGAVRQLAVLGLQPESEWLAMYMVTVQGRLNSMSLAGLVHVAEGLALMHAAPRPEFLGTLMVQGEKGLNNLATYDPRLCGLLLGCAHALRQNTLRTSQSGLRQQRTRRKERREEGERHQQEQQQGLYGLEEPLSDAAMEAWGRVHRQLVTETRKGTGIQQFKPDQLVRVVSAVAAYELTRPYASTGSINSSSSGRRGGSSGSAAACDLLGRVTVKWLQDCTAGLLHSLSSRGGQSSNAFLPLPSLLLDLLRLTSCVLYGSLNGEIRELTPSGKETSQAESDVKEAVTTYVRRAMDLLVQGANLLTQPHIFSLGECSELLKAVVAAGIKPGQPTINAYAMALFPAIIERVDCVGRHTVAPVTTPSRAAALATQAEAAAQAEGAEEEPDQELRKQLFAVWSDLEAVLNEVLLPVLPTMPNEVCFKQLREGLLESSITPVALEQASWQQLGLLCTYGLQVGSQLLPPSWWQQLHAEVARRNLQPQSPMDLAQIYYGLQIYGLEVAGGDLLALRATLGATDSRDVHTLGRWDVPRALHQLHLLWASHQGGFLAAVPEVVWEGLYGSLEPNGPVLASLRPQQLGQLVELWANRMRVRVISYSSYSSNGGSVSGSSSTFWDLPAWSTVSWLTAVVQAFDVQEQQVSFEREETLPPLQRPLEPLVAALAVGYCFPRSGINNISSGNITVGLQQCAAALLRRALPALESALPLSDISAFLEGLERRGLPLPQQHLQALAIRLAGQVAMASTEFPSASGTVGTSWTSGSALPPLAQLEPVQAVRVMTALLSAKDLDAALPVLVALMPCALDEVLWQGMSEDIEYAILSSGLEAIVFAAAGVDVPASRTAASCAAYVSATATASMVQALLMGSADQAPQYADKQSLHLLVRTTHVHEQDDNQKQLPLEALPPMELARLAEALLEAAGSRRLPPIAAAVIVRIFSLESVVQLVPISLLERALQHNLAGEPDQANGVARALPMLNTTYRALTRLLMPMVGIRMEFTDLLTCLQRCGAKPVHIHQALLGLRGVQGFSAGDVLMLLRVMVSSGVRERVAVCQRPPRDQAASAFKSRRRPRVSDAGPPSIDSNGPYAQLALQLIERSAELATAFELQEREAAEVLRLMAVLNRRLEGLGCADFWLHAIFICNSSVVMWCFRQEDSDMLFEVLEAAFALGGYYHNMLCQQVFERWVLKNKLLNDPATRDYVITAQSWKAVESWISYSYGLMRLFGPYLIPRNSLRKVRRSADVILDLMVKRTNDPEASARYMGPNHSKERPWQLGALLTLLTLPSPSEEEDTESLALMRKQVRAFYVAELEVIVESADYVTPLERLVKLLDALEPIAFANVDNGVWQVDVYDELPPLSVLLCHCIKCLMDGDSSDQPRPEGVDPLDDILLLCLAPDFSEHSLREALFLSTPLITGPEMDQGGTTKTAAANTSQKATGLRPTVVDLNARPYLKLPAALRPPTGRRHGMPGDAAGDAAREAYVSAAAPWLIAGQRLLRLVRVTESGRAVDMYMALSKLPTERAGRWAYAIGTALREVLGMELTTAQGTLDLAQGGAVAACEAAKEAAEAAKEAAEAAKAAAEAAKAVSVAPPTGLGFQGIRNAAPQTWELVRSRRSEKQALQFLSEFLDIAGGEHGAGDGNSEGGNSAGGSIASTAAGSRLPGMVDEHEDDIIRRLHKSDMSVGLHEPDKAARGGPAAQPPPSPPPPRQAFGPANPFDVTSEFMRKLRKLGF